MDAYLKAAHEMIRRHEGFSPLPYQCPSGAWTIGWGRNLTSIGLSAKEQELFFPYRTEIAQHLTNDDVVRVLSKVGISNFFADVLLNNDIEGAVNSLNRLVKWWSDLTDLRRAAMVDMVYNLGINRFMGFKKFLGYLKDKDYENAGAELVNSVWWSQVGDRAKDIYRIITSDE
jgi:Phage-related lysozyme (muraminidase)